MKRIGTQSFTAQQMAQLYSLNNLPKVIRVIFSIKILV